MFKLLDDGKPLQRNENVYTDLLYVFRGQEQNQKRAVDFITVTESNLLKNSNLLITILTSMDMFGEDNKRYLSPAKITAMATHFRDTFVGGAGLVSDKHIGGFLKGNLYGDIPEVWISLNTSSSKLSDSAVKVLRHPFSYTNFPALGTDHDYLLDEDEIAVITIDIPLLALQYAAFIKEQLSRPEGERHTKKQFIQRQVIPKLLDSHYEVTMVNAYVSKFTGLQWHHDEGISGVMQIGYESKLKRVVNDITIDIVSTDRGIEATLWALDIRPERSIGDWIRDIPTDYVPIERWAYALVYTPILLMLREINNFSGVTIDNDKWQAIAKTIKQMNNDGSIRNRLGKIEYKQVQSELSSLK